MKWTYKDAGVNVESGYRAVSLIKEHIAKTHTSGVVGGIGGFAGLYALNLQDIDEPILVSGTDGVGTKLQLAFELDKHDTIGIDCVAMCVNDIICQGATPLFFLDYLATGKLEPKKVATIVKGIANGCQESNCALIGGETAEMPGFYKENEYDMAGFVVGIVDKKKLIHGEDIQEGDRLIGLSSSGVHSNGYSLVRKLVIEEKYRLDLYIDSLDGTVGEALLEPTRIYVKPVLEALKRFNIKGIAHITGGGFIENIPRMLPEGLQAKIQQDSWPINPVFNLLQEWGNIEEMEMFNTFNMGIGMVIACPEEEAESLVDFFTKGGYPAYKIGWAEKGEQGVLFDK